MQNDIYIYSNYLLCKQIDNNINCLKYNTLSLNYFIKCSILAIISLINSFFILLNFYCIKSNRIYLVYKFHNVYQEHYILGCTSVWLILPVAINLLTNNEHSYVEYFLIIWTLLTCAVSTIYWYCDELIVLCMDRICAHILYVYISWYLFFEYRNLYTYRILFALISIAVLYYKGMYQTNKVNATLLHLSMRYIGYWCVYFALVKNLPFIIFFKYFLIKTIAYYGHIFYSLERIISMKSFNKIEYIYGCLEVITLVFLFLLIS